MLKNKIDRLLPIEKAELMKGLNIVRTTFDKWVKFPSKMPLSSAILIRNFINKKLDINMTLDEMIEK